MGDAAERAARLTDPVGHGLGMLGLIGGALIGAVVGAVMIVALPVCAPLLVGALVGVAAVGAVAGGALAGDQLMHGLQTAFALPDPTTGMIGIVGSFNVFIGELPAARAMADAAAVCNGLFSLNHLPIPAFGPPATIAEGSSTVLINNLPAARVTSKLICGGEIKDGCPTVIIGGETIRVLPVHDLEAEALQFFGTMLKTSLIAAGVLTFFMGGEAILTFAVVFGGFYVANEALGAIGDKIGPGWGNILQGGFGLAAIVGGGAEAIDERFGCGEPVDAVTGEVFTSKIDFELPGALPIRFQRGYASSLHQQSWLGPNWCCSWGQSVQSLGNAFLYFPGDGRTIRFELGDADSEGWIRNPKVDKIRLRQASRGFEVRNQQNHTLTFAQQRENALLLSSIADLNGNAIHFNYYSGILRTVVHTGGYRLHVNATASHISGIALEQSDGTLASLVRYEYDTKGRLQGVDNGSGRMLLYEYDDAARLTGWQDRQNTWYRYQYDEYGRCVESVGPNGMYHYRYAYDPASRSTIAVDSYGATNTFRYNEHKKVVAAQDPMGGTTYTEWDERGNKLSVTDPEGRRVGYEYDSDGNLVAFKDTLGRTFKIEHNQLGSAILFIDASGRRWAREYDARGNLIEAGLEGESSWRYERDARGNLIRVVDPAGRSREFGYNAAGLPIWVSDWQGNKTRYIRDSFGRIIHEKDPLDSETTFAYNRINKLAGAILPDGAQIQWEYDCEGNLISRIGPDGSTYSYSYGPFDTLQSIIRPSGAILRFHNDLEGRLIAVENEKGQQWKYLYDAAGRVIGEQDFAGRKQAFAYDGSGLRVKRINGKGEITEITRNKAGQIIRTKASDGAVITFEYDTNGFVSAATNQWTAVRFERDEYGRIVREIQGDRVIESFYDERGLRTKRRTSEGQVTRWSYDENGRVQQISLLEDEWLDFARDAIGRDLERHFRQGQQDTNHIKPGGFVLRQNYDPLHRLVSQWAGLEAGASRAVTAIAERQYRYDVNSNPTEIYDNYSGTSRYRYDCDDRITSAQREEGPSEDFQYDVSGNISAVLRDSVWMGPQKVATGLPTLTGCRLGLGGRVEQIGNTSYFYDEGGRVIQKSMRQPGQDERVWKYEWTAEDQFRSVINDKGEVWKYEYDAFGRRTRKIGPDTSTTYVWDGDIIAEEIRTTRASSSSNSWIFELDSFRPVAKLENGKAYACVLDQIGTPRELVSTDGTLVWSAQLSTWGEVESERANEVAFPIRFQGQWYDAESGLHYNFHRYYDPQIGQYLSPDPIGLEGGTRTYGYVHNPLGSVDPLGLTDGGFYRGAKPGEDPSFEPRPNEYRVRGGNVQPTHGVSVFDNPQSVTSKGFEAHQVDTGTVSDSLKIQQRGNDPKHYEIMPKEPMPEDEFKNALRQIKTTKCP